MEAATAFTWTQGVTLAIAVVGLLLSIFNTWHGWWKVRPVFDLEVHDGDRHAPVGEFPAPFVRVVNRGAVPVTTTAIWLENRRAKVQIFLAGEFPARIEPYGHRDFPFPLGVVGTAANNKAFGVAARTTGGKTKRARSTTIQHMDARMMRQLE